MNNQITIKYITDEGLLNLKSGFDSNYSHYFDEDNSFFKELLEKNNYLLDSNYKCEDFAHKLVYGENEKECDYNNVRVIYDALKHITPNTAMDERFWTSLTHTYLWEYVKKRREIQGTEREKKYVHDSFFRGKESYGKKRSMFINCVVRLWWSGYLTYDSSNVENPYHLTYEICKTALPSTILLLSSSNILSKKSTIQALLMVIKNKREQGYKIDRQVIVNGFRYLNLMGGITLIDFMSKDDIMNLLETYYENQLDKC